MKTIKYPAPDRSKFIPLKEKDGSGTMDIGWNEGVTTDGRPYHAEMWAFDSVSMVTIFLSSRGMQNLSQEELVEYLEKQGLVKYFGEKKHLRCELIEDDAGESMWSLNITIGDDEETFADTGFAIKPY